MKKCPFCAEDIKVEAIKCKHCGERLDGTTAPPPPQGAAPTHAATEADVAERTLLELPGVTVTTARAVFGPRTFATAHINTSTTAKSDAGLAGAAAFGAAAVLVALLAAGAAEAIHAPAGGAAILAIIALYVVFKWLFPEKYIVVLETSSGRTTAYTTSDRATAQKIADAVSEAIIARART